MLTLISFPHASSLVAGIPIEDFGIERLKFVATPSHRLSTSDTRENCVPFPVDVTLSDAKLSSQGVDQHLVLLEVVKNIVSRVGRLLFFSIG